MVKRLNCAYTNLYMLVSVFLFIGSISRSNGASGTWQWDSGSSGIGGYVPSNYSGSTSTTSWDYQFSGTFTRVSTSNMVSVSASVTAEANATSSSGNVYVTESASGSAYGNWNWTGAPGTSPAVTVRGIVSYTTPQFGTGAASTVEADYAGTYAEAWGAATVEGAFQVQDGISPISGYGTASPNTTASVSGTGGNVIPDMDHAIPTQNASITYQNTNAYWFAPAYGQTFADAEFEVDIDQTYSTTAGASTIYADALLAVIVDAEAFATPSGGNYPSAWGNAKASLNGTCSVTLF